MPVEVQVFPAVGRLMEPVDPARLFLNEDAIEIVGLAGMRTIENCVPGWPPSTDLRLWFDSTFRSGSSSVVSAIRSCRRFTG